MFYFQGNEKGLFNKIQKSIYTTRKQTKNKEELERVHERNFQKLQVNETCFGSAVQASKTQHEGKLIILVHSSKQENEDLVAKVTNYDELD